MHNYPTITGRKIRMALVGCGRIAANHFGAMEQHAENVEIVDVCDVDRDALDKAVQRTGAKGHLEHDRNAQDHDGGYRRAHHAQWPAPGAGN